MRNSLTEYFRVDDLENIDEVKRAVAFLFYKHGPIDRIESHNEYWLELDAALREQFNVFGAKPDDLKKTKFKSENEETLQKKLEFQWFQVLSLKQMQMLTKL